MGDDLEDAARQFEERLREVGERLSPYDEALWQHTLGQVYYRQGKAENALRAFQGALEIWRGPMGSTKTSLRNCSIQPWRPCGRPAAGG
jgi:tetratricopeptide (TPR) repeat protein